MSAGLISPASNSRKRVCQIKEVSRGVTPTNPNWKTLPHLEATQLDANKTFERSGQMKSNRMGGQQIGGNRTATGTIAVPLKNDSSIRDLFESAFSGLFAFPVLQGTAMAYTTNGTNASASAVYNVLPLDGDTITINGVLYTYRSNPVLSNDVALAASLTLTLDNLIAVLTASVEANVMLARYSKVSTTTLKCDYKIAGTAGNAFTVAWANTTATIALNGAGAATSGSGTMASGTGTPDRITHSGGLLKSAGFRVGSRVTTATSTTAGNNQTYKIINAATDGTWIELDRDIHTAESFAAGTTLTSNAYFLSAGTSRVFFSYEVSYLDLAPVVYEYFFGEEVNEAKFEIPTSGEATAEFQMIGLSDNPTTVPISLGSGARAAVEDVVSFAGSINGAALIRDGAEAYDTESITATINNNREAKFAVGLETASFVDQGDFDAEIQASIYFTSLTVRNKFRNGVRMAVHIRLEDQRDGHQLLIEFNRCVITAAPKGSSGNAVTEQVSFFAEEDPTTGTKAQVWFIPSGGR